MDNIIKNNIHTHTTLSDGTGTPAETVEMAISLGFSSLGISDHSYTQYDDSCIRTSEEEYAETVRDIAERYKDKLEVYCGLELDSFSTCKRELYDYIIGSVHSLLIDGEYYPVDYGKEKQQELIETKFGGDQVAFAKRYFDDVALHIESCKPDVVGHFDLITKYDSIDESDPNYREAALSSLRRAARVCRMFEVNTGGMARGHKGSPYPAPFLLREILSLGCHVTITSDCHNPSCLDYAFDDTAKMLRSVGFTDVYTFGKHGFTPNRL